MIKGFKYEETCKVFRGERSRKLPSEIQRIARRKLRQIDAATNLNVLRVPPTNRLEALKGRPVGQ